MYFFLNEGHGVWECFRIRGQSLCYLFPISSIKITDIFLYQKRKQEHILCDLVCSHTCNYTELCHMNGFCNNSNIHLSEEFQKGKGDVWRKSFWALHEKLFATLLFLLMSLAIDDQLIISLFSTFSSLSTLSHFIPLILVTPSFILCCRFLFSCLYNNAVFMLTANHFFSV